MTHDALGTDRPATADAVFLAAVVALSCLPYVTGLGFYSDDWSFLSALLHASDDSLSGLYESLLPHGLATRPLQAGLLSVSYALFGLDPLGYHILNSAVFVATVVLFHLALRALGLSRWLTVSVPLVFALLPNYSTDRFWIAAFQANLSMGLYMLSLYGDLRFAGLSGARASAWKAVGTAALLGSVLAYEVAAPLFVLNVLVAWLRARAVRRASARWRPLATGLILGTNLLVLAGAVIYKATTTQRTSLGDGRLGRFGRSLAAAVDVHFGEYGLQLPLKVGRALRDHHDLAAVVVSLASGLVVFLYLRQALRTTSAASPSRTTWFALMAAGVVVFAAGYGVSLMAAEIGFHPTGVVNRTAIAAAVGVALTFVAVIGWATSWMRSERSRRVAFIASIALLSTVGCLLTNTIATFWVAAAREQQHIVDAVRRRFPTLPSGTTILLAEICPYLGPGVVFETSWDVRGMLQVVYDDVTLRGNVVRPNLEVSDSGIRLRFWGDMISLYPYGDRLLVFSVKSHQVTPLPNVDAARLFFGSRPPAIGAGCAAGVEGSGAEIF